MDYLGDKLTAAHTQVSGWVGSVRRSLQGALSFVSGGMERSGGEGGGGEEGGGFKRAASLRSLANRSRESFRRFSLRSQQRLSLRRRTTPTSPATPIARSPEQVKQTPGGPVESKDTDTLVCEADSQYGTWETGLRTDESLTPATPSSDSVLSPSPRSPTPPLSPEITAPADGPTSPAPSAEDQPEPLPFPETPTTLLDSSALRSRVQLSKKRKNRAPPSRTARHSAALAQLAEGSESGAEDWRSKDSTDSKPDSSKQQDSDSDSEDQPRGGASDSRNPTSSSSSSSSSQPQRVSLFPGMDPSALMAQLKKRGETESQTDSSNPSASQLSRSPKSPFLPRASRVLPPAAGGKENGEESSPQWLKELKSKKRLSQYENDS